jgi:hypothetical protein
VARSKVATGGVRQESQDAPEPGSSALKRAQWWGAFRGAVFVYR